jgi:hypothetical protein
MAELRRIGLDEVARHFEALEDPRSSVNRKHPLVSVLGVPIVTEKKTTIFRMTVVQTHYRKRRFPRRSRDATAAMPDPSFSILESPSRNGFLGIVRLRWVSRKPEGATGC